MRSVHDHQAPPLGDEGPIYMAGLFALTWGRDCASSGSPSATSQRRRAQLDGERATLTQ